MSVSDPQTLAKGLKDPVMDAQTVFRAALAAMAAPGLTTPCLQLSHAPLPPVMAALALTLLDYETPYALTGFAENVHIEAYLSFHTGARRVDAAEAAFALLHPRDFDAQLWRALPHGTADYPDTSATVILDVERFDQGFAVELSGPGLREPRPFCSSSLAPEFWEIAVANAALYPLGVDFLFCGDGEIAALPRSTGIRMIGEAG